MRRIENADDIDRLKNKDKGELTAEEHARLKDLQASRGPTKNTHRGIHGTGPRNNR